MTYTKDKLRQIFQQPFSNAEWQQMLQHYFMATELRAEPERIDGTDDDEQGYYLGSIDTSDNYLIGLFYYPIRHGNVARRRVGLRNLVKSLVHPLRGDVDAALVVFDDGRLWRLSFVCDMKGESTAPKRYTYVFGESDNYYNTPVGRFDALQRKGISFANIMDAFSVEALSKEFFDKYREHYADIVCYITGKRYVKEKGKWVEKTLQEPCHEIFNQFAAVYKDPEKTVRDYIKKLLGRIVFLQFLQKKGWLGVPADREDWTGGDRRFLQNKFKEFEDKENFIDGFLEPLFNDLNTKRTGDLASPAVGKDIKIPFLNGGLFHPDGEDDTDVRLPQKYLGGLLEFFEQYNFTIDENDPNDAQVGVDPEMLGRVFENLLEDNKDKGAFYTPKEIVQYMCRESLTAYLQTDLTDDVEKEAIRSFVLSHDATPLGKETKTDIDKKLNNVKICDPAIGSGAFPMGLLRELYLCRCAVQPETANKDAADIKRRIIQNNIYGVDIEKGAVDIARLRFWLSLIVDEETPKHLPNLDFKIMQGNSLLEQYNGVDLSKMTELKAEKQGTVQLTMFDDTLDVLRLDLRKKLNEYYNCSDRRRKEELKQEIINNVKDQLEVQGINVDFGDLDLSANDQFTLWHTWFYDVFSQGGFDIVIANPPYISHDRISENIPKKTFEVFEPYADIYCYFIEQGLKSLKLNGVLCFITSNSYLRANYGNPLRQYLHNNLILQIIDMESSHVFASAVVDVAITIVKKGKGDSFCTILNTPWNGGSFDAYVVSDKFFYTQSDFDFQPWTLIHPNVLSIRKKIEEAGKTLEQLQTKIRLGLATGDNNVFIIDEETRTHLISLDKKNENIIKPVIRGQDIKCYCHNPSKYIILSKNGIDIPKEYPTLYQYFDSFGEKFKKRGAKGRHWTNLRACAFFDDFLQEKLIWIELTDKGRFSYSNKEEYLLNSAYFLIPPKGIDAKYLLGILNSNLMQTYMSYIAATSGMGTLRWINNYVKLFPIPIVELEKQKKISILVENILALKEKNANAYIAEYENSINKLVYNLYGLTYDEIKIIDPETYITREEYEKEQSNEPQY